MAAPSSRAAQPTLPPLSLQIELGGTQLTVIFVSDDNSTMGSTDFSPISCAFTAPSSCTHESLFKSAYKRTNRMNRTKIVRCFPHCCSGHKTRSYCGSSVMLSVMTRPTAETKLPIQVFARFRPALTEPLRVDQIIPTDMILSSLQSDTNTTAEWVSSQVLSSDPARGSAVYVVNATGRWLYAWDSGKTMAHRLTRHVLEVVVVTPFEQGGKTSFRIVATIQSSKFTLASFRRETRIDMMELQEKMLTQLLAREVERQLVRPKPSAKTKPNSLHPGETVLGRGEDRQRLSDTSSQTDARPFNETLAVVLQVIDTLPATRLAAQLFTWESSRIRSVLDRIPYSTICNDRQLVDGVGMGVLLACWLRTDRSILAEIAIYVARAVDVMLDIQAMKQLYEKWMDKLSAMISAFLAQFQWTWGELIGALSREESVGQRREYPHAFDWLNFIARVQQSAIDRHRVRRHLPVLRHSASENSIWVCRSQDVQVLVRGTRISLVDAVTTGLFLRFVDQLSAIRVNLQPQRLRVVSASPRIGTEFSTGVDLILDANQRQFASLPNGDSSLGSFVSSSHSIGDYIGSTSTSESTARAEVTCFAWPHERTEMAYRWRWVIITDARGLHVSIDIDAAHIKPYFEPLENLRTHEKLALAQWWTPRYSVLLNYRLANAASPTFCK